MCVWVLAHLAVRKSRLADALGDRSGSTSLEAVLLLGLISIPLITFLAGMATYFMVWVRDQAPTIYDEATTFLG